MPEILTECPTCDATGPENVYRAAGHPTSCSWMMDNEHRCVQHDELLLPDEETCPNPEAEEPEDEDDFIDVHNRLA